MKTFLLRAILLIGIVIFQVMIVDNISFLNSHVDFVIIATLFFALHGGSMSGQVFGFIAGIFYDAFAASQFFGITPLTYTVTGFIVGKFSKTTYQETFVSIFTITIVATLFKGGIYLLINTVMLDNIISATDYFLNSLMIELIVNPLIAPFVFFLIEKLNLELVPGEY